MPKLVKIQPKDKAIYFDKQIKRWIKEDTLDAKMSKKLKKLLNQMPLPSSKK